MSRSLTFSILLVLCYTFSLIHCYCVDGVGPKSPQDSNLGFVKLEQIDDQTNCDGDSGPTYVQDFTSKWSAELGTGKEYELTYLASTCGTEPWRRVSAAWIDYNQNGIFDDSENLATTQSGDAELDYTIKVKFTVPTDAVMGTTRMRVMLQESSATSLEPCATYAYGGVKDFGIEITAGGLSGGWIFTIIVLCSAVVYVGGGYAYNNQQKGKSGMDAVPHLEFWQDLPALVKDGTTFFIAKSKQCFGKVSSMGGNGGEGMITEGDSADYDEY
jgi:hypothetical protein